MGTYNVLQANINCPHCNTPVKVEIEMRFGNTSMMDRFVIGDLYKWVVDSAVQKGGRPAEGNLDGEGYTECPQCQRDFFVKVMVRGDRINYVLPDMEKAGYIQESDSASFTSDHTDPADDAPKWKPKPRVREIGRITYNEKWILTHKIENLLGQLVKFGVDIFSTMGGSDYTILVPLDLSRDQLDEVDVLLKKLSTEVIGKLEYIDWYPHGWKFRIDPRKLK
jgi:hypothetical protein